MFALDFFHLLLATYRLHLLIALAILILAFVLKELPSWVAYGEHFFRRRGDPSLHGKRTLEWTFHLRHLILTLGGLATLAGLTGLAWTVVNAWQSPAGFHLAALALWMATLALLGLSMNEGLAPWFSPLFRGVTWRIAKALGNPPVRLRDAVLWALLAVVAVSLTVELFPQLTGLKTFSHSFLLPAAACGVALVLLAMAYRVRRRIVVQPFVDKDVEGVGTGLAVRLQHELARIQSLYEMVDEVLPDRQKDFTPLSMSVEDVGAIFKDAVGPDATLGVGLVKIPIGAVLSAFGVFLSGPRITGSVQRDGSGFTLFAEMSGGGWSESWQVDVSNLNDVKATLQQDREEEDLKEKEKEGAASPGKGGLDAGERVLLNNLVRLLACRIFTTLVPSGSPRWQAIYHFTEGLRSYRETQKTDRKRDLHLRRAEQEFLQALSEDKSFTRCQCNLGVIYHELGLDRAEEAALRRALAEDPDAVDASFGMAILRVMTGRSLSAQRHCENALRVQAANPEVWNLLAVSQVWSASADGMVQPQKGDPVWSENLEKCEIATALAWRKLFQVAWSGRPALVKKHRQIASLCLSNLAVASDQVKQPTRACVLLRQALGLAEETSWISFQLGKILYRTERWREADAAFARIYDEALDDEDRADLGLYLLGVHLIQMRRSDREKDKHKKKADEAYDYILDLLGTGEWQASLPPDWMDNARKPLDPLSGLEKTYFDRLQSLATGCSLLYRGAEEGSESADGGKDRKKLPGRVRSEILSRLLAWEWVLFELAPPKEWTGRRPKKPSSQSGTREALRLLRVFGIPEPEPGDVDALASFGTLRLEEWVQEQREDAVWLLAQVFLRHAELLLEGRSTPGRLVRRAKLIEAACTCLSQDSHGLQYRRYGLYRLLAQAYLSQADLDDRFLPRDVEGKRMSRQKIRQRALTCAEKAVAWNPQGASELLVLGQVYAALSDWPQATEQWEKMLSLEPGPETWSAIASACFPEEAARPSYQPKSGEKRERLHRFLREALSIVESEPLSEDFDDDQIKAHAGLHFCLGKSYLFDRDYGSAKVHLTIAHDLGYRMEEAQEALDEAIRLGKRSLAA